MSVPCHSRIPFPFTTSSDLLTVLVTVLTTVIVLLPLLSVAVGGSKLQAAPCSTVLLVLLHVISGAVVSTTITVCLHRLKLPQASVVCHTRVASKVPPQ